MKRKVTMWAWQLDGCVGLCHWAWKTRKRLVSEGRPDPDAVAVRLTCIYEDGRKTKPKRAKRG